MTILARLKSWLQWVFSPVLIWGDEQDCDGPFLPDWASCPGETISVLMKEKRIDGQDLVELLELSPVEVLGLLTGKTRINFPLAAKLSALLGSTPGFWLRRDEHYVQECQRLGFTPGKHP